MLPSSHRLPKEEIPPLLRYGFHARTDAIELVYRKRNDKMVPRFAFIVSIKIDKRATARNRMRRVLSESVRHILKDAKDMQGGIDGIFIARKNIAAVSQEEAERFVVDVFIKVNFLKT